MTMTMKMTLPMTMTMTMSTADLCCTAGSGSGDVALTVVDCATDVAFVVTDGCMFDVVSVAVVV